MISEEEFLKNYDINKYERPSVTNDVIIITTEDKIEENIRKVPRKGMQVLLVKRDEHPYLNKWAIPGGFIGIKEDIEEGARRKLEEETGVRDVYLEQLYTFGDVDRDVRTRVISIANLALISKDKIKRSQKNSKLKNLWFWIDKELISNENNIKVWSLSLKSEIEDIKIKYEITECVSSDLGRKKDIEFKFIEEESTDSLAFDHYKILSMAIDRIRNKLEYTQIAFNLVPRLFTVKELQNVYEGIMGKEIQNFRRKLGNIIIETDEKIEGKPYRPAKMFKFNENWEHNF